ncbi:hypothetical protein [Fluviicola sp.]
MNENKLRLEVRKVLNEWSEKSWAAIDSMMSPNKEDSEEENDKVEY